MRKRFFQELHQLMKKNKKIWAITGDLGYIGFDKISEDFPDRFVNTGAAEQAMMGIAVGLALEGKIPFVYSISTFLLYRPYETIRNYINHENIPVKMIGSGRGKDYSHDGISHWIEDDKKVVKNFKNVVPLWPKSEEELPEILKKMSQTNKPFYLNLSR